MRHTQKNCFSYLFSRNLRLHLASLHNFSSFWALVSNCCTRYHSETWRLHNKVAREFVKCHHTRGTGGGGREKWNENLFSYFFLLIFHYFILNWKVFNVLYPPNRVFFRRRLLFSVCVLSVISGKWRRLICARTAHSIDKEHSRRLSLRCWT